MAGGQKRWRKRSLEGLIAVNGVRLLWRLLSEPQQTREHGYKGLRISVTPEGGATGSLFSNIQCQTNILETGHHSFPNVQNSPSKQLRMQFGRRWRRDGTRNQGARARSSEFQTETLPHFAVMGCTNSSGRSGPIRGVHFGNYSYLRFADCILFCVSLRSCG